MKESEWSGYDKQMMSLVHATVKYLLVLTFVLDVSIDRENHPQIASR
jgi:hypothetical protein